MQDSRQAGLQAALQAGLQTGRTPGRQDFRQAGLQAGLQAGKQAGLQAGLQAGHQAGLEQARPGHPDRRACNLLALGPLCNSPVAAASLAYLALPKGWPPIPSGPDKPSFPDGGEYLWLQHGLGHHRSQQLQCGQT